MIYCSLQVVVCSFVYGGGSKVKTKQETTTKDDSSEPHNDNKLASPVSVPPGQNYISSPTAMWPGSQLSDVKSPHTHTGIDLTRG